MLRPLRAMLALLLTAFALAGCMKIELDITINANDTVDGSMIFAMEKSVLTMGGKTPKEAFGESVDDLNNDLPKGSRTEVYEDSKYYGQRIIFEAQPLSEFNKNEAGTAEAGAPTLVHADGKYTFTMDANMSNADLGPQAEALKPILDTIELKISITFPGKVIERDNLAELNGNTVSWTLKMSSNHKLKAVGEEPEKTQWLLLAGVGGLAGVLVIAGIVFLAINLNGRKRRAQEMALVGAPDPFAAPPVSFPPDDLRPPPRPGDEPTQRNI